MSRAFSRTLSLLRKLATSSLLKRSNATKIFPKRILSRCTKLILADALLAPVVTEEKHSIEDKLKKACSEGEAAIIELMSELKDCIVAVSQQYRICLQKQIEITQVATVMGPMSEKWDDLPEVRTSADDYNHELNEYITMFNTIGQMAYDQTMISFLTGASLDVEKITNKYKELEILLLYEFELNKQKEIELLNIKRDSILSAISSTKTNK